MPDELEHCVLGWRSSTIDDSDASVPPNVKSFVARALCATGTVTFPSTDPSFVTGARVVRIEASSLVDRVRLGLARMPRGGRLVSTDQAAQVERAFDDPGFPWWMQGQVLLVSDRGEYPELSAAALLRLLEPMLSIRPVLLDSMRVRAVLRPGTDGTVAAFLGAHASTRTAFLESLSREAQRAGFEVRVVDDDALAEALAAEWELSAGVD